jgi:hypothetical protein
VIYLGRHTIGLGTRLAGTELTAVRYGRLLLLDGDHPIRARTLLQGPVSGTSTTTVCIDSAGSNSGTARKCSSTSSRRTAA